MARLAYRITAFLRPFLPYLTRMGETDFEEAGERFGDVIWGRVQEMWSWLRAKPQVATAAEMYAQHPDDEESLEAFRLQLTQALAADNNLEEMVRRMMLELEATYGSSSGGVADAGEGGEE
jgi:hypothetical protein